MLKKYWIKAVVVCGTLSVLAAMSFATNSHKKEAMFFEELNTVNITPPETAPEISEHSVDLALKMFSIKVDPTKVNHPKVNIDMDGRGVAIKLPWENKATVEVGDKAFYNWGLLGSTLAHEIEVHCEQNFVLISFLDFLGLDGTLTAERVAYQHELRNSKRFGLDTSDIRRIHRTMEFYYPAPSLTAKNAQFLLNNLVIQIFALRYDKPNYVEDYHTFNALADL